MSFLKSLVAFLPEGIQNSLKRIHFARQIKRGTFLTNEPEFLILDTLVHKGDWVLDIGANVGHYTNRLSALVGESGRVIAFEPVPTTFSLLSANALTFPFSNVTLINAAVSGTFDITGMSMPTFTSGLTNYYEASLSDAMGSELSVLTMPLDAFSIAHPIAFVKIDAEGHEAFVIAGMKQILLQHRPILVVETASTDVVESITTMGYTAERLHGSHNVVFTPNARPQTLESERHA